MKNKFIVTGLLMGLALTNIANAEVVQLDKQTVLANSPMYVVVSIGVNGLCADQAAVGDHDQACLLKDQLANNREWMGSVEAVQGNMTVAQIVSIGTDETLKNAEGDLGKPSSKIDFDFKTQFNKGFVLKVQPNADYENNQGKLIVNLKQNGVAAKPLEIPYSELQVPTEIMSGDMGIGANISSVVFEKNATLAERNIAFKNKAALLNKLLIVENWYRSWLLKGDISADLYRAMDQIVASVWFNNVSDTDMVLFQQRYSRLLNNLKQKKATPALFFGGLNKLMKRIEK